MVNVSTSKTLYCGALVASLLVACGKNKTETVYVDKPQTTNPQTSVPPSGPGNQTDPAKTSDAIAVEIKNFYQLSNQNLQQGAQIEFGLKNSSTQISGVQYKCSLDRAGSTGTTVAQECSSPYTVKTQGDGQYTFTVYASHTTSNTMSNLSQVTFNVGSGYYSGQPGQPGYNGGVVVNGSSIGSGVGPQFVQVGDLFLVTVPVGMHKVYRTSTYEYSGYLKFQMIDRRQDTAAPFPLNCGQNMEMMVSEMTPAGRSLNYCELTPSISYNSEGNPFNNAFRFMTMNTLSYNSLQIASDNTLTQPGIPPQNQAASELHKLSINVFSNPTNARGNQFQAQFATEFSQTVSLLQISCGSQPIVHLGNAGIFQGFYHGAMAVAPIFGCVHARNGQYYASVGTFPMDNIPPGAGTPACGQNWACWSNQPFRNIRAAEIVVEMGPFKYQPKEIALADQAQGLMLQNIKKLVQ